jgi:hypothetical protein
VRHEREHASLGFVDGSVRPNPIHDAIVRRDGSSDYAMAARLSSQTLPPVTSHRRRTYGQRFSTDTP